MNNARGSDGTQRRRGCAQFLHLYLHSFVGLDGMCVHTYLHFDVRLCEKEGPTLTSSFFMREREVKRKNQEIEPVCRKERKKKTTSDQARRS